MLDRLWDFFVESCTLFFVPLICIYYSIGGNLFLNSAASDAGGIEQAGNTLLAPFQYIFKGQTALLMEDGRWVYKQRFDYHGFFWLKSAGSIIALPASLILGSAIKGLAYLSPTRRSQLEFMKSSYFSPKIKSNLETYQKLGLTIFDPERTEWVPSQGYTRRPGDEKHLQAEKEALREVGFLLTQANIPWWVDCGTCLGAYRYGGVIPWDGDIDIAVLLPDFDNVRRVLLQLDPQKYLVQDWSSRRDPQNYFKIYIRKTKTLIDIYYFAIEPSTKTIRYIFSLDSSVVFPEWVKIRERRFTVPAPFDIVFPLKKQFFDGIEVFIPNDPLKYLQRYYGENLDPVKIYDPVTNQYEKVRDHPYWQREYAH
jgi:phosphorylcholine metabolism protein LicD